MKKGGAGQGNWGKPGDEIKFRVEDKLDEDSDEERTLDHIESRLRKKLKIKRLYSEELSMDKHIKTDEVVKLIQKARPLDIFLQIRDQFAISLRDALELVFTSEDGDYLQKYIEKVNDPQLHSILIKRLIQVSFEKNESVQEFTLGLIIRLFKAEKLKKNEIRRAFDWLYLDLPQILIDSPLALKYLMKAITTLFVESAFSKNAFIRIPKVILDLESTQDTLKDLAPEELLILNNFGESKVEIINLLKEFYESFNFLDIDKFFKHLSATKGSLLQPLFIRKAIELALDKDLKRKELSSQLLLHCKEKLNFLSCGFTYAFDDLLGNSEELAPDYPEFLNDVSKFLVRALSDGCLPPHYISEYDIIAYPPLGIHIIKESLANIHIACAQGKQGEEVNNFISYSNAVWGAAFSNSQLRNIYDQIIFQFLHNHDFTQAMATITQQNCLFFMHEFVKRLIIYTIEHNPDIDNTEDIKIAIELLKELKSHGLLAEEQVEKGYLKVIQVESDITLDIPYFPKVLELFKEYLMASKLLIFEGTQ